MVGQVEQDLKRICDVKFGGQPTDIARPATGRFNNSLFFTLDGREMVFRMAPSADQGLLFYEHNMMAQEPEVHELVRAETDIPVAEILLYDDSCQVIDRTYLIMERMQGEPLSYAAGVDSDEVFRQVGEYLRQLHEIVAEEYGYLGAHRPMAPAETWAEAFDMMWNKLLDDIVACDSYSQDEAGLFRELFNKDRGLFDRYVNSSLLHMDIWHENILVDDSGKVTAILDWDRALWGDAEIEFAVLDYCGISTPAFWAGYGRERDTSPEAAQRAIYYYLYELQKYILIRKLRNNNPNAAESYKTEALRIGRRM